jgi:lysosomal acid phosphatase
LPTISARSFATNTYTPELARLKTGPLLKEILDRSTNKTIGKLSPNRSMWVYSAHDTTVANVLNTLGLFEYHNPPYRACIMIELRQIQKKPYISIFYKNTTDEPVAMYIPNCGPLCPLEKMYDLYEAVLPKNLEQECQLSLLSMPYVDVDFDSTLSKYNQKIFGVFKSDCRRREGNFDFFFS